jgi:hypothetical protein
MILFFARLGVSADSVFDIFPPIKMTSPGELGYWSFLGVATNMRTGIHFSPDSSRQNGGICHRIGTTSQDWFFSFRARITNGSLVFVLSDEVCPYWAISNHIESWRGISVNFTRHDENRKKKIFVTGRFPSIEGNQESLLCKVDSHNITFKSSYRDGNVTFSVLNDHDQDFIECGPPLPLGIFPRTFVSFVATSYSSVGDLDLYHTIARINDPETAPASIDSLDQQSRAHIFSQEETVRVRPILPLASRIVDEMEKSAYKLSVDRADNASEEIRALFGEIRERLAKSLSPEDLRALMHSILHLNLARAEKKMEKRREAFSEIGAELDNLKGVVREKLNWLSEYVVQVMGEAQSGAAETLNGFLNLTQNSTDLQAVAKHEAKEVNASRWPTVLSVIAAVEVFAYLTIFCVKQKRTRGFKKLE